MKIRAWYLSSFILALVVTCLPGFAYTYDGDDSDTMWGTTINEEGPIVLSSSSSSSASANSTYNHSTYGFSTHRKAAGVPVFIFNPQIKMWAFYNIHGNLVKVGKGSGGRNYCSDWHRPCKTPTGTFRIYLKQGAGCKSTLFPLGKGGAPMPYCSYFSGGYAVHGSYEVRSYNASHGCIRVYPSDAKWLQSQMPLGSIVIVMPY